MARLNWFTPNILVVIVIFQTTFSFPTVEDYLTVRNKLQVKESMRFLGANLVLTGREQFVNNMLMAVKQREFQQSADNLHFIPAMHFFHSKPLMLESQVFQFIRQMPKGVLIIS